MVTAIIVGAGHRSMCYGSFSLVQPERFKVVGVADPNMLRCKKAAEQFGFGEDMIFHDAAELVRHGKLADCVINGTMDEDHVRTTVPLLEAGYDVLLEKPFAVSKEEVKILDEAVRRTGRKVMICHVLRYSDFYVAIKERILKGEIGKIVSIQTSEHVSYHHVANCFIRGKWRREDVCKSTMLMSKCCHDMDLLSWFMSGVEPVRVSSFGGRHFFRAENAPENAGEYCLLDCPLEKECIYSNRNINLNHPKRWGSYVWTGLEHIAEPTEEEYTAELKRKDNPYARCIWKMDNNVVDRQAVMVEFADGAVAVHNMIAGTSRPCRKIHIIGTAGEIEGTMDDSKFVVRKIDTRPGHEFSLEEVDLTRYEDTTGAFGGHGGGDMGVIADFVSVMEGNAPSISCTALADSINGHLIGFLADEARVENKIVEFK
ncbi:MAG: Gfo/Idh/MocA family oxidoreductase [Lentisphaeria bacterium]|nr:Gfo/Idh/MocA family oxidoreductase [Lentisphaeria bacterium]